MILYKFYTTIYIFFENIRKFWRTINDFSLQSYTPLILSKNHGSRITHRRRRRCGHRRPAAAPPPPKNNLKFGFNLIIINANHVHLGENKVQEALEKWTEIKKDLPNIKLH